MTPHSPSVNATNPYDSGSFAAGQDCGTRVAACLARTCALELLDGSRWWNRRGHRRMAAALVAYAEELESAADAGGRCLPFTPRSTGPSSVVHPPGTLAINVPREG
jgi:hypothetical protein